MENGNRRYVNGATVTNEMVDEVVDSGTSKIFPSGESSPDTGGCCAPFCLNQSSSSSARTRPVIQKEKLEKKPVEDQIQNQAISNPAVVNRSVGTAESRSGDHIYQLNNNPRLALIINNENFEPEDRKRQGADVDVKRMVQLLRSLHFTVTVKENLTAREMKDAMIDFTSEEGHKYADSTVVVVMSHGTHGDQIFGIDDETVHATDLLRYFSGTRCRSLINKPKIFILQACRGDVKDDGAAPLEEELAPFYLDDRSRHSSGQDGVPVDYSSGEDVTDGSSGAKAQRNHAPTWADFLISWCTMHDHAAWRNTTEGSIFISSVYQIFQQNSHHEDILSMLTMVNRKVALFKTKKSKKQMAQTIHMLTKRFYFRQTKEEDFMKTNSINM